MIHYDAFPLVFHNMSVLRKLNIALQRRCAQLDCVTSFCLAEVLNTQESALCWSLAQNLSEYQRNSTTSFQTFTFAIPISLE